jgi:hypothetical protein
LTTLDLAADGWSQCSVLPAALAEDLAASSHQPVVLEPGDLVVVASHDCDVTNRDERKEPWVELLAVHRVGDRLDGNYTIWKNPRRLDFEADLDGTKVPARVFAAERWFAARRRLAGTTPAGRLRTDPADLIPRWLSQRYVRVALPDEFNNRWLPAREEIRAALAQGGEHISAIYIQLYDVEMQLADEELPPDRPYRVLIRATMLADDYEVTDRRALAQRALDRTAGSLDQCPGIEILDDSLESEATFTLADMRMMRRWSPFDHLSLPEQPGDEVDALPVVP